MCVCVQITCKCIYSVYTCKYTYIQCAHMQNKFVNCTRCDPKRATRVGAARESLFREFKEQEQRQSRTHTHVGRASEKKIRITQTTKTKCGYEKNNNNNSAIKNSAWSERCVCVLGSCLGVCDCVCEVIIFSNDAQ